jgi:CDP-diacylglycerol pyrophosphatase
MWSCLVAGSTERRLAIAVIAAVALTLCAPPAAADPDALWKIVDGRCAPDQRDHRDPAPCVLVDLDGGYAVLKDLVGNTQFLLIPTARVSGIESAAIVNPNAPDYLAAAWRARSFVEQRARRALPRDWMSLSVNSSATRSQDQLHVHIDCVRADVREALAAHPVGPTWQPFGVPLAGQRYRAMSVGGDDLAGVSPFRLLADGLPPGTDMGAQTLVVVGAWDAAGRPGFVLLAGQADPARPGSGHGEDLQDHVVCPPPAEVLGK